MDNDSKTENEQQELKSSEDEILKKRQKQIGKFLKNKIYWIFYIILAGILSLNVYIRTRPMHGLKDITTNNWTLGPDLDPFVFLRYAKYIVEHGKLMVLDTMRYVPLGFRTAEETKVLPYMIAYLHKILGFFGEYSVEYSAVIFPVIASVFTALFFFLLVRKIFQEKGKLISNIIAIISTGLMIMLPALISRTVAGIPEKESIGFTLMFLSFYLFLSAWKSEKIKNALIIGILAGISTALMALVWGGVIFIYTTIAIAGFIAFMFGKVDKKELIVYGSWLIASMVFWIPFTARTTLKSFLISATTGISVVIFGFMIVHFVLFKTKLKNNKILQNNKIRKIPKPIISIIVALILMLILSVIVFGPKTIWNMGFNAAQKLVKPYDDRLSFTVAENRQPYFSEWAGSMGPSVRGLPLFFWVFFVGSIFLFYDMIKKLKSKEKSMLTMAYTLFLFTLIFSRYSGSSILNGESGFSLFVYVLGYVVLFLSAGYVYYIRYKKGEISSLKNLKFEYILLFSLLFIGIIGARSAIRLVMALLPIAAIIIGYVIVEITIKAIKTKDEILKFSCIILAILLILSTVFIFYSYYHGSIGAAKNHIPTHYHQQWQYAMSWVRENTPEYAVFGHWWDYGYWVQSIGERATMLDGGNAVSYWNYLMGRHGLTAETEEEALELLYSHNVTHFLIDSTEIGKYSAYSSIGSDESYDRYSWIGTLLLDTKQTQETRNQTVYVYPGGVSVDENIVLNDNGKEILLPRQRAGIAGLLVAQNEDTSYDRPYAIFAYNGKRYDLPLRYLYINGELIDFGLENENTLEACAYVFPSFDGSKLNTIGASMYLSPRNLRALWVRLYLLGEGENFKLVHEEPSMLQKFVEQQIGESVDLIYYGGIQGSIKIWEIEYTGEEEINPEYLQKTFPERIAGRHFR